MPPLHLQTLGALRLSGPDGELLHGRRRELVLLVHLARHAPRAVSRQQLAELLWGGRDDARARQSLRQALYVLRSALGAVLDIDAEHVRLAADAVELDAAAFERDVANDRLAAAVSRWEGDFLAGMEDLGDDTYRAWVEVERESLRRRLAWTLERLVTAAEQRRAWDEAARWSERWAAAFPLDEAPQIHLVRALGAARRTTDALACHAGFVARLREELGGQPSDAFLELGRELARAPGGSPSPGSTALFAPDLVGRDAALAALDAAWRDVRHTGAVVLVEGEEGIGRTRLCRAFLRRLQSSTNGPFVLETRAAERDMDTSWATARRLFAALRQAPGLLGAPDQALAELSVVAPALRARFSDLPEPTGGEATLAAAAARVLEDVAAETPVLVHVDDVTRADPATQRLLLQLALAVPPGVLLVLGVCTDTAAAADINVGLQEASRLHRVKLQPLAEAELETMLDSMLPLDAADRCALAARLHMETGGNPLYTVELVSALADTGLLAPGPAGAWRVGAGIDSRSVPMPAGLRAAVLTRIEHLSAAARQVADTAAVLGDPLDPDVLQEVAAVSDAAFAGAFDELLARRILRPPASPGAGYEFTHGLIRRVVHDALPAARRQALHRAALRAWVRRRGQAQRVRAHRPHAGLFLPGLRLWLWLHPRAALAGMLALLTAAGVLALARVAPRAAIAPDAVAIFPFAVQGGEALAYAGQAVASLLATSIDGAGTLRSIDPLRLPRAASGDDGAVLDPERAQTLAARLGAGHFILGTLVESRGRLQASAALYDGGSLRTTARVVADSDGGLFELTDALARELLSQLQPGTRGERARAAASTTTSLAAFKEYLTGESALQNGRYDDAIVAFQRALERDTTFALASYRMAVAAEWRADLPTLGDALERALRQRDRLPERYRLLAAADSARHAGAADDAERRYRDIVARHPEEALAWYYLGEVLIHFNPLRGRGMAESQHAFERALALDTGNYEARWHLAQLAVSARDTGALARWIEPLLAGGDRDRIVWRALRDALHQDSAALARSRDALDAAHDDVAYAAAWFVPLLLGDFHEGARLAETLTQRPRVPEWRAGGHVLAAHAELARGRFDAALAELEKATALDARAALAYRAWFSALPFVTPSTATLSAIRDELLRWDAAGAAPGNVPHPFVALHDGAHEHLRLYLLGVIDARLGNTMQAERAAEELRRLGAAPHAAAFGADLARAVEAEVARLGGDPARALVLLDAMQIRPSNVAGTFSPFYSHARERFVRAELLHALGRADDAARWYASVAESPPFGYVFLGPSLLRRAELHEQRGAPADAALLYREFIEVWDDADAALRPLVYHARRQLMQLIDQPR
jgi:DNA-binding SARP family transcriptional activator/tetratricopeptide (TPR) repeat protein